MISNPLGLQPSVQDPTCVEFLLCPPVLFICVHVVDTYVCNKLRYFVHEALQIRDEYTNRQIHNRFQAIVL